MWMNRWRCLRLDLWRGRIRPVGNNLDCSWKRRVMRTHIFVWTEWILRHGKRNWTRRIKRILNNTQKISSQRLVPEFNSKTLTSNLPTLLNGLRSPNGRVETGALPILLNVDWANQPSSSSSSSDEDDPKWSEDISCARYRANWARKKR